MIALFPHASTLLETVGRWMAGYVLLSLSLALIWMALVTAGRLYQRHLAAGGDGRSGASWPSLPFTFQYWHREQSGFSRQLLDLERSMSASRAGNGNTSASAPHHDLGLRA